MSGDFLSRWSRLKRSREAAEPTPAQEPEVVNPAIRSVPEEDAAEPRALETEPERARDDTASTTASAADLPLPSLDDLTAASDLGPFLRANVPVLLRNAALRRMWSLDPSIRDFVSEAREYAYDWNCPGAMPGLGPLLPSDDVEAMVRRLFKTAPAEPPADPSLPHEPESIAHPPPHPEVATPYVGAVPQDESRSGNTEDGPAQDRIPAAGRPGSDQANEAEIPFSEDPLVAADALPNTGREAAAGRVRSEMGEPATVRRVRRHGGAMPC